MFRFSDCPVFPEDTGTSFPHDKVLTLGLCFLTWQFVWNFGGSRENVFDMYGDYPENLLEILAVVIISSPISSVRGAQTPSLSYELYPWATNYLSMQTGRTPSLAPRLAYVESTSSVYELRTLSLSHELSIHANRPNTLPRPSSCVCREHELDFWVTNYLYMQTGRTPCQPTASHQT